MISFSHKRTDANVVLTLTLDRLERMNDNDPFYSDNQHDIISVESYQNSREQGHALMCYFEGATNGLWIGFAENRNTDDIVVYYDISNPMRGISNEAYDNRKYFNGIDKHVVAAEYICNLIREHKLKG